MPKKMKKKIFTHATHSFTINNNFRGELKGKKRGNKQAKK